MVCEQQQLNSIENTAETFDTNFFGPVALTQELLPLLQKAPAARIVNLSSIMGSLAHITAIQNPRSTT